MIEREGIPIEKIPDVFKYLHEYVPYLKYWEIQDDYRRPDNKVGHVQRAHSVYWSIIMHKKTGGLGLDVGCGNVISPYCIGVDYYADSEGGEHPVYGGHGYKPHICARGEHFPFKDEVFDWIISNHSLEHMENTYETLNEWLRVLKPKGIMAIIMPDRKYGPFGDPSHKHEYTPDEFFSDILVPLLDNKRIRLLEYDTFNNHFSFNCIFEKSHLFSKTQLSHVPHPEGRGLPRGHKHAWRASDADHAAKSTKTIRAGQSESSKQNTICYTGFRRFDKVLYGNVKCFIYALRSSGYFDLRDIEGNKIGVSVNSKKLRLLERARGKIEEVIAAIPPRAEARGLFAHE